IGCLPLVIGMPVMITQNFDVESGVVNGCQGTLSKIRYRVDAYGNRHAISCVVRAPTTTSNELLPFMETEHDVAVLEDSVKLTF
ncbi:hypothetical protein BDP27DRAFT_1141204, partial [Rhodocollybia butyracea]